MEETELEDAAEDAAAARVGARLAWEPRVAGSNDMQRGWLCQTHTEGHR